MGPDLVAVFSEEALDVRMEGFDINFAGSDDVCLDRSHVAEKVKDVNIQPVEETTEVEEENVQMEEAKGARQEHVEAKWAVGATPKYGE